MTNFDIVTSTSSIEKTKIMMISECDKLIGMIKKYQDMFEETKNIYDTDSATLYRRIATAYLELINKYVENDIKTYIANLDDINKIYKNEINAIAKTVRGDVK